MKALGQFFTVVLFITLYSVVLTFGSVVKNLTCDHSNESYWVVLLVVLFITCEEVVLKSMGDMLRLDH